MHWRRWKNDIAGGVTAALSGLPVELVYGLIAVAPLGAAYADHGLRAAIWGCILGGILGLLLRTTGGMMTGSRPATALLLAALATDLLDQVDVQAAADPAATVFGLLLLCTALAGLFQFLFGWVRVGRALKYVPYPVIAGLMCGVGLLMLLSALRPALGIAYGTPWHAATDHWHPLSLAVMSVTLALCFLLPRWTRRIPGTIAALIAGTLLHHALAFQFNSGMLGTTSVSVLGVLPAFSVWQAAASQGIGNLLGWLPTVVPYAVAIAAFASLETLLCLATIDSVTHVRANADRELRSQGLANLVSGVLGATPSTGNLTRVMTNLAAGGRSPLSGAVCALGLLFIVMLVGNWIGLVPSAATAGILLFFAYGMVDDGTRRLVAQVLTQRRQLPRAQYDLLLANLGVIVLVALVAVLGDMLQAVGAGVAATMFLFIKGSMKPVIRRVSDARHHRSLKVRSADDMQMLEHRGAQIAVIEIEGPLFFGTADRAAREIEAATHQATSLLLDLRRVSDVDTTGARTLLQVARKLNTMQRSLSISGANQRVAGFLGAMGLQTAIPAVNWHPDMDTAMESLEDALLARHGVKAEDAVVNLSQTALAAGLDKSQTDALEGYLARRRFEAGGIIFRIGDVGDSLFVASDSVVDILVPLNGGHQKRVASFAPGMVFGEMALLEGKPRSADAKLQGSGTVWELSRERMAEIELAHPKIARQILLNLSRSLAMRLRMTTVELRLAVED